MSTIVSGFENVPEKDFSGIYADLYRFGWPMPEKSSEEVIRDEVVEHLRAIVTELIQEEITRPRHEVFYAGLDDAALAAKIFEVNPAIFQGVPYAPNCLQAEDLAVVRA